MIPFSYEGTMFYCFLLVITDRYNLLPSLFAFIAN